MTGSAHVVPFCSYGSLDAKDRLKMIGNKRGLQKIKRGP
jgi:hypothetical protein